jgi:cytochrome c oxidase cbb3-type subunit IV
MELNTLRSLSTVMLLLVFVGIVFWAYSRQRLAAFDAAARLPLIDDDAPTPSVGPQAAQTPPPPEGARKLGNGPSFSQEDKHE